MEEKTWLRKYGIHCLLALMILVGLMAVIYTSIQPHVSATVYSAGETTSRSYRTGKNHTKRKTVYITPITVDYTAENGETQRAHLEYSVKSRWNIPKKGDSVEITRNPFGQMISYPDQRLNLAGWVIMVIAGVWLIVMLIPAGKKKKAGESPAKSAEEAAQEAEMRNRSLSSGRIVLREDDSYQWVATVEEDEIRNKTVQMLKIGGGVSLAIVLIGAVISFGESGGGEFMVYIVLVASVFMLIMTLVSLWMKHSEALKTERYTMYDEYVQTGYGKYANMFTFARATEAVCTQTYLELKRGKRRFRMYVCPEDMPFLRAYVLKRLPAGTRVTEE